MGGILLSSIKISKRGTKTFNMQSAGVYHISKRKRLTQSINLLEGIKGIGKETLNKVKAAVFKSVEGYPSEKFWISFLDKILMVLAVVSPLMAIPQVYEVYWLHNVQGLSFISWASWALFNLPWLVYGFIHKQKPIIVLYILWFLVNTSIAVGILLYS